MKFLLDTNVIISHFKSDEFSEDTDKFFAWIKDYKHKIYIADITYAELYTGIYLSQNPKLEEKKIQQFLAITNIEVKYMSSKIAKRAGELYAKFIIKNNQLLKQILPDFIIGANAELYSDALITWNPSDYNIDKPVQKPLEFISNNL